MLIQIASADLDIQVTAACDFHKRNKGAQAAGRVLMAAGTFLMSEVACGDDCDNNLVQNYYETDATLIATSGQKATGQPLAMSHKECDYYKRAVKSVHFYSKAGKGVPENEYESCRI